jgi:membrane protease YdiL (CAAX protease family)
MPSHITKHIHFSYFFLLAGFPEEVFYRVLLQGQLSSFVGSLGAVLIASLIFGWIHIPSMRKWHQGRSIPLSGLSPHWYKVVQDCSLEYYEQEPEA